MNVKSHIVGTILGLLVLAHIFACTGKVVSGDGGDTNPPTYDYYEDEPNNSLEDAQFIAVLPESYQTTIWGTLWIPQDSDCYSFFLNPPFGANVVLTTLIVQTMDTSLSPKLRAYQTVYDLAGDPIGYQLLNTWVGTDGYIEILDFPVPYDSFDNNDLIIQLDGWSGLRDTPLSDNSYTIDFWNN